MIIRLEQLGEEPFHWQEELQLTPAELAEAEFLTLDRAEGRGQISRTVDGFLLRESLTYTPTLVCTRCLTNFVSAMTSEIDLLILVGQQETSEELQLNSEDLGVLYLPEPVLDTRPLLLEQLHLGVPLKILCRDDCAGLCRECGDNLNQGSCGCQQMVDPRWTALKNFKQPKI